jgi:uncharacterized damage-inducible protein DinB
MSQIPVWFERKFDFSARVEMLPLVLARLRGTPARLEELLSAASHEARVRKPEGKWSAQEHAGHLWNMEPLWLARVGDYSRGADGLTPADLTNRQTDDANYNRQSLDEILAQFRAARARLLKAVEELDRSVFSRAIPHPRLKTPLHPMDHLFFVAEHDDHHLAHIWELVVCG